MLNQDSEYRGKSVGMRKELFLRDRGVCSVCGSDTVWFAEFMQILYHDENLMWHSGHVIAIQKRMKRSEYMHGSWEADHIVPVADGGGICKKSNFQTICGHCHTKKTIRERMRRKKRLQWERDWFARRTRNKPPWLP